MSSKIELKRKPELLALGFIHCNDEMFFPQTFIDANGATFSAKPDYWHPVLNIYVETKASSLNGVKTKAQGDKNKAEGRTETTYDQIKFGWNHAAPKQSIVQHTLSPNNFIILFINKPDKQTLGRMERADIHAVHGWRYFMNWYLQAKIRHGLKGVSQP